MERTQQRSVLGSVAKGLFFTALTGAMMAGIFMFVTPAIMGAVGIAAEGAVGGLASVGISTGIFGGLVQGYLAVSHNMRSRRDAHTTMRGGDAAITAASSGLITQAVSRGVSSPTIAAEHAHGTEHGANETTHWRNHVGKSADLKTRLDRIAARDNMSHTDRLAEDRARAVQAGQQLV